HTAKRCAARARYLQRLQQLGKNRLAGLTWFDPRLPLCGPIYGGAAMLTKGPATQGPTYEDGYWAAQGAVEAAAFLGPDPAADNPPFAGYYPPTKVKPCRDPQELMIRVLEAVGEQLRQLDERRPRQIAPATAKRWAPTEPPKLPELMKPDGAGLMPLSCAVQLIAERGGTRKINPLAQAVWR